MPKDGAEFVREVDRIGFDCEVLSAEEEARLAGEGVLSAIPEADGIVGDLGGGSLELVDVADGEERAAACRCRSACCGSTAAGSGEKSRAQGDPKAALKQSGMREARPRPDLLHGRRIVARARPDRHARDAISRCRSLINTGWRRAGARSSGGWSRRSTRNGRRSSRRRAWRRSPVAAMILDVLVEELEPAELVVSSFGIREGLLLLRAQAAAASSTR